MSTKSNKNIQDNNENTLKTIRRIKVSIHKKIQNVQLFYQVTL